MADKTIGGCVQTSCPDAFCRNDWTRTLYWLRSCFHPFGNYVDHQGREASTSYIEDNFNWGLGFGIPCIVMVAALLVFLLGTRTYWFTIKGNGESPFVRIGKVFVEARPWPLGSCYNKSCFQFVGDFQRKRLDSSWFVQLLKRVSLVYTRHALLLEELTVRLICLKMHRKLFLVKNVLKMSVLIFGNCFECFLT